MNPEKKLISMNYTKGAAIKPKYVVIHETANTKKGADALAHFNYWNTNPAANSSAHFVVDDTRVIQLGEFENGKCYKMWHVGDNKGRSDISNDNAIGIEICVNSDGNYEKARENAIELTKYVLEKTGLTIAALKRHYDAWGKRCPANMLDKPDLWSDFVRRAGNSAGVTPAGAGEKPGEPSKPDGISPQNETINPTANDETIWRFLTGKGLNPYAAAGVMGNLFAESGLKAANLQNSYEKNLCHTDESYTKAVDDGTYTDFVRDKAGYGLAQWTYWSRKEALISFANAAKKSIGDLAMQLDFFWKELQGYTSVMKTLNAAKSVREASDVVLLDYERPAVQSDSVKMKRAGYGQGYYDKFANKTAVTPPVSTSAAFLPYTVCVTADALNYRKGPGTNYAAAGTIHDRGMYTIIEEAAGPGANKWGKLKSGAGWISLDFTRKM